jgi:hypothetical protein
VIDKVLAAKVLEELKAAANTVFAANGLSEANVRATYGDVLKITLETCENAVDESGINMKSKEAMYYLRFGFTSFSSATPEKLVAPLGTRFTSRGREFVFAGIAATRKKYPVYCVETETNEVRLFSDAVVTTINRAAELAGATK